MALILHQGTQYKAKTSEKEEGVDKKMNGIKCLLFLVFLGQNHANKREIRVEVSRVCLSWTVRKRQEDEDKSVTIK